ncbi:uncharacterized protein LOC130499104 [Raphanus sativus]|uniref:Uncharacterized protein LOC130499104 n=1 Tax=Raphanus sativus TaxID=3726 RepID=A0A9W3CBV2_RAPSA|nr:uncharacterized protein LOC130499104 [Raphanus sativus]
MHWKAVLKYAYSDANEWKMVETQAENMTTPSQITSSLDTGNSWKRPPMGWVKCNVDGSFYNEDTTASAGWVVRNTKGTYQYSGQAIGRQVSNALEAELQAVLMAIQHCWSRGHRKLIIENDNKKAINLLNGMGLHFAAYNWIRDIRWWMQKFEEIIFQWTRRTANRVADKLAKNRLPPSILFQYHCYVPMFITTTLHEDYVKSSN